MSRTFAKLWLMFVIVGAGLFSVYYALRGEYGPIICYLVVAASIATGWSISKLWK